MIVSLFVIFVLYKNCTDFTHKLFKANSKTMKKSILLLLIVSLSFGCAKSDRIAKEEKSPANTTEKVAEKASEIPETKEELSETAQNAKDYANWAGNYECYVNSGQGDAGLFHTTIVINKDGKAVFQYAAKQVAVDINATLSVFEDDKAELLFESYGAMNMDKPLKKNDLVATLIKNKNGFNAIEGVVEDTRMFKKVGKLRELGASE